MPNIPLPEVLIGEFTVFRPFTAPGLFAYRHSQALRLLDLPGYAVAHLDAAQRREALEGAVALCRPLSALVVFLNVVALEDFIRDLGARLADHPALASYFPSISGLRIKPGKRRPNRPFARLDTDAAPFLDPGEVNKLYQKCLGIQAIPASEHAQLRDLALLRHTVAHHGAVIRSVDVQRFQHYIVQPEHLINPPVAFVREVGRYSNLGPVLVGETANLPSRSHRTFRLFRQIGKLRWPSWNASAWNRNGEASAPGGGAGSGGVDPTLHRRAATRICLRLCGLTSGCSRHAPLAPALRPMRRSLGS